MTLLNNPTMITITTPADLRAAIEARFPTSRAFCVAFTETTGVTLDETTLSRQLSGRVAFSSGWLAAYRLFFLLLEK